MHVKGYDYIYCWEHCDCTKANECICVSVGRICVFNVWNDCCIRCGCDNKPVESLGGDGPVSKVCAVGETVACPKLKSILRVNRVEDSCANQFEVPNSVIDLSISGVANLGPKFKTQPSSEVTARECVKPCLRQREANQHSAARVQFAVNAVYATQATQANSAQVETSGKVSHCSLGDRPLKSCGRCE